MRVMRPLIVFGSSALAICLSAVSLQALPIGTQAFANIGTTLADGSSTGNIEMSTMFDLDTVVSTGANSGFLAGMPTQTIGLISFTTTVPTSLDFGNSVFGNFTSLMITEMINAPGVVALTAVGNWTPGTYGGETGGPFLSDVTIALTQTPAETGAISASFTFATPSVIPETSTLAMIGFGMVGLSALLRRKRAATT